MRIVVEVTDPAQMVPAGGGEVQPTDYQHNPSGVKVKGADVVYRIRVSRDTDPLNIARPPWRTSCAKSIVWRRAASPAR